MDSYSDQININFGNEILSDVRANSTEPTFKTFTVTVKFGGIWVIVKNQERRKYDGGKQKSIKLIKDQITLNVLRGEVERICPWLRGIQFELHYHMCGTSPKQYELLASDDEVSVMISMAEGSDRSEIVVITTDVSEPNVRLNDEGGSSCIAISTINQSENDNMFGLGTCFSDSMAFKQALRSEAIRKNFGIRIKKSDKKRVIATCSHHECSWRIRASLCADGETFEIRKLEGVHTCPGINRTGNKLATSSWIANEVEDIVKRHTDVAPKQLNEALEMNYGLSLPYMKLWRSREKAREKIFGSDEENYKWIPALRNELVNRNPGSHITYTFDAEDKSFKRFFVSFKVCIDGFLAGCRPLIGLDACHLKSKYLGVLLAATTLDGNHGLYTLAFAIVETESKSTWEWFLENLHISIGLALHPLAFISDMEKGLAEAVRNIYPDAEHRVCMRHLWKNLKRHFQCQDGKKIKNLVWNVANAYTRRECKEGLDEISNLNPHIHAYLTSLPYIWCRCSFSHDIKNDSNTSNMSESFNSWILDARSKPAVDLVDHIRGMIMEQRFSRKTQAASLRGVLVPFAEEYIRDMTTKREYFIIKQATTYKAEVEGKCHTYVVDIEQKTCSCMVWQMTGLPCIHTVAFVGLKEHPLWHTYVDSLYHVERYRMAYEGAIGTLPSKEQWEKVDDSLLLDPPNTLRPRGRPKKRRMRSFLETSKKSHKCGRCGSWGHHRSSCKNPLRKIRTKLSVRRAPPPNEEAHSESQNFVDQTEYEAFNAQSFW